MKLYKDAYLELFFEWYSLIFLLIVVYIYIYVPSMHIYYRKCGQEKSETGSLSTVKQVCLKDRP